MGGTGLRIVIREFHTFVRGVKKGHGTREEVPSQTL